MSRGIPKFAARRDANERALRISLATAGWLTQPLSIKDWPDLLCAKAGRMVLCEIKSASNEHRKKGSDPTRGQRGTHELLALFGVGVVVCRTAEEFLRAVGDL